MNPSGFQTIRKIHDAFDRKEVSPTELAKIFLNAAKNSAHNDFLTVTEARALEQARAAEAILSKEGRVPRARMPLLGIPLGLKDNLVVDGVRTTCGSKMLESYVAPYTATSVARLEAAGAVTIGKLNLDEFAMGGSNENSAFGPVKHATHPDRVPGGSSGGSATAVKAGHCVASLGSDTGGSIRLPASYSGVVGLKPTYGRVSRYGLVAFASSLDQIGPIASSVEDAGLLLDAMAGHDPLDSTSAQRPSGGFAEAALMEPDWKGLRVGLPREYFGEGLSAETGKAVQDAASWLEKKGAKLVPVSLPHTRYSVAVYYVVAVCEASSNLARFDGVRYGSRPRAAMEASSLEEFYKRSRAAFGAEVKRRIILGTFALSSGYYDAYYKRACQVRRLVQRDFEEAFKLCDVIASPVAATTAFKLGEKSSNPLEMYLNDIFTIPANLAGIPALSVPCGKDAQGLPIGLQLAAPAFEEARLLSVAGAFERGHS